MKNKIAKPEIRNVKYDPFHSVVWETVDENKPIANYFKVTGRMSARIIHQDKYTIVILEDGNKGVSKCMEGDTFSRKKGLKIAFNRALIQHLEKETKKLSHEK